MTEMIPCVQQSRRGREFRRWKRPPRGATAMEYMVLILLVAISLIAIIELFAGGVQNQFHAVVDVINEEMGRETEEGKQRREERRAAQREERQASAAASGQQQEQGAAAPAGTIPDAEPIEATSPPASGSVGGINPVVFIIGLGLLLLLGYVVFGKKKGG